MINKFLSEDQLRILSVSSLSPFVAYLMPTKNFLLALIIMFAFNIWAGMRADGVSIARCKNFRWSKFKNALFELLLYLVIIEMMYTIMDLINEKGNAITLIKTITIVFLYVYSQNAFKNLVISYPKNKSFRIIYHLIRFEFKRASPSHVQGVIERIENEIDKEGKK